MYRPLYIFFLIFNLILLSEAVPPACGPNQIFVPNKNACPPTCEEYFTANPHPSCLPRNPPVPGCECAPGHVLDCYKNCVLPNNCSIPRCVGQNEVFQPGAIICTETCQTFYNLVPKPPCIDPLPYPDGCHCLPGFVRDEFNICILPPNCPPPIVCTLPNEEANFCPPPCDPRNVTTCAQYLSNTINICPSILKQNPFCVPRCDCAENYLRNAQNQCVRPENCCSDSNQIVVDCPNPCPLTCDTLINGTNNPCTLICPVRGCVCKPGYVLNASGVCILRENCPLVCSENEEPDSCPNNCRVDPTCSSVLGNSLTTCTPSTPTECTPRCFCRRGFVRIGGICVPESQCCSDINEETATCPTPCDATCEATPPSECQISCTNKRCVCKLNFVRDKNGRCIPSSRCPRCINPNEEYKFSGTACQASCFDLNPTCSLPNVDGCFCKPGFVRHLGVCVLIPDCPLNCQNETEVYVKCGLPCPTDETCSTLSGEIPPPCPTISIDCVKRCSCVQGLVRIGDRCVSPDQCCTNPAVEEAIDCPVPCDNTCEGRAVAGCIRQSGCKKGCHCRAGLVRNINRECVPLSQCPVCNGTNEVYKFCSCDPTCDNPLSECTSCVEGCFCSPGFVRYNGNCILPVNCPPRCVDNEVLNICPAQCTFDNTCDRLFSPIPVCTTTNNYVCQPRCDCREGFVRIGGVCVTVDRCCNDQVGEHAVSCSQPCDGNCERTQVSNCSCSNLRCACRNGFVRNIAGVCVDQNTCPRCTGENEVYKFCGTACPATCTDLNPTCTEQCVEGCFCLPGFVRFEGKCIPIIDCPLRCGANEVYNKCPSYCTFDLTCSTVIDGIFPSCPPPPTEVVCVKRCECLPGFVRIGGNCVSADQCCRNPATEEALPCPVACDDTCDGPSNCTIANCALKACRCRNGLVRHYNGNCVTPDLCPKCNANEVYKVCGTSCPPTCDNKNPTCIESCSTGCFCKPGYIRHRNVCIPEKKCPPVCGNNEVLVDCPNFCAFDVNCDSLILGITIQCTEPPNYDCVPKCFCQPGYVRIGANCVAENQCCPDPSTQIVVNCTAPCHKDCFGNDDASCIAAPCLGHKCRCKPDYVNNTLNICAPIITCPPPCVKPNEEYKSCGTKCEPTCFNRTPACTKDCAEGCFCKNGFIRQNDACIAIDDCPLPCNKSNEEYKACGTCDPTCDNLTPACTPGCNKGCFCKPGFVRNNDTCIPQNECIPTCPGPNEEFLKCGPSCVATCDNRLPICSLVCQQGCFCKTGYIRQNGTCIKIEDCPVTCNANEVYTTCGTCDPTCEAPNKTCQIPCQKGCFCKDGYVKNDGKCILLKECPVKCPENEVYKACGTACQPTCQNPISVCYLPCKSGCFCLNNMVRKNGVCVNIKDCSCPVNEVYTSCCPKVQATCAVQTPLRNPICKPCCICAPGYVRNGKSCVKISTCV